MDKRKNAPYREAKAKSSKTNIHISSECHQGKAGYPPIRRDRKCRATQNPHDGFGAIAMAPTVVRITLFSSKG
jgi:hypothetical protein